MDKDRFDREEVWAPVGKWARRGSWRSQIEACRSRETDWNESEPPRRRPAMAVIAVLWVLVPCMLLAWSYRGSWSFPTLGQEPEGLVYATECSQSQLLTFRQTAVHRVCEPTLACVDRLVSLRNQTEKGTVCTPAMTEELESIKSHLKKIMTEARSRPIPETLKHNYIASLYAIDSCSRAVEALEDAFTRATPQERERLYEESVTLSNTARRQCEEAQSYFDGDGSCDAGR